MAYQLVTGSGIDMDAMSCRWKSPSKLAVLVLVSFISVVSCVSYIEKSVESPVLEDGRVVFRMRSRSARTVQVAGDWNNWGKGDAESGEVLVGLMEPADDEGLWELTVKLPPGRYRYRFVINETRIMIDPSNPRVTTDIWGGKASLLIMP